MIVIPHCEGDNSHRFIAFMELLRGFCEVKVMAPIRLPKQPSPETDPARSVQEFLCSEVSSFLLFFSLSVVSRSNLTRGAVLMGEFLSLLLASEPRVECPRGQAFDVRDFYGEIHVCARKGLRGRPLLRSWGKA